MRLDELFDDGEKTMVDQLRNQVMDYITPLAAKDVDFIPMQDVQDILRQARTGLVIDRGIVMRILEPNECKLVDRIEGDKIYLSLPVDEISARSQEDEEKEAENIQSKAMDVAKKAIGGQ